MGSQHYDGFSNRFRPSGSQYAGYAEATKVLRGCIVGAPTTASTIGVAAGAHDFNANVSAGAIAVDGKVVNVNPIVDAALSNAASGNAYLAIGQSVIFCLIYYRSKGDGAVRSAWVPGTPAAHATVVRPTKAQVQAALGLSDDVIWLCVGETRLKCTADAVVSQEYNNAVAPFDIPDQEMPILQG